MLKKSLSLLTLTATKDKKLAWKSAYLGLLKKYWMEKGNKKTLRTERENYSPIRNKNMIAKWKLFCLTFVSRNFLKQSKLKIKDQMDQTTIWIFSCWYFAFLMYICMQIALQCDSWFSIYLIKFFNLPYFLIWSNIIIICFYQIWNIPNEKHNRFLIFDSCLKMEISQKPFHNHKPYLLSGGLTGHLELWIHMMKLGSRTGQDGTRRDDGRTTDRWRRKDGQTWMLK